MLALTWLACSPDPVPAPIAEASDNVPTVWFVSWSGASDWSVEAVPDGGGPVRTASSDGGRATLLGLAARTDYTLVVHGGDAESEPIRIRTADPPADLPTWTVEVLDRERSDVARGYIASGFVEQGSGSSDAWVADGEGGLVWWWQPGDEWDLTNVTIGAEGRSFVWGQFDASTTTDRAAVAEVAFDGSEAVLLDTPHAHHVAVEPEPGRYAWIELEVRDRTHEGRTIHAGTDRVMEADADGQNAVELFNAFDDLYADGFHYPCFHSSRAFDRYGVADLTQWTHGNSLVWLPGEDALFVFERWADTLVKIDRATGTVAWQMGGPDSDFTLPDGDPVFVDAEHPILWSHGHLTEVWEDGLLMYDNGNHSVPRRSRIARYQYDEDARTVKETWSVDAPGGAFTDVLGDARPLPAGHVLATGSRLGTVEEITPEGEVVWRLQAEPGYLVSRTRWFASWGDP